MAEYEFNVAMSCSGCSNAVNKALSRVPGLNVDISLDKQLVNVKSESVDYDTVLHTIQKTGKTVHSGRVVV